MATGIATGARQRVSFLADDTISKRGVHVPERAREALRVSVRVLALGAGLGLLATARVRVARRPVAATVVSH